MSGVTSGVDDAPQYSADSSCGIMRRGEGWMPMAGVHAVVVRGAQAVRRLRQINKGVEAHDQRDDFDEYDDIDNDFDDDWE